MSSSSLDNARAALAEQLTFLQAQTPSFVSKLAIEAQPGPAEWLFHSLGGCACGSCGDGDVRAGIDSNLISDGRVGSYSVECLVRGPSGDPCFGKLSYRLRITVGAHTAGFGDISQGASSGEEDDDDAVARPWPVLRFLDEVHHLGVEYSDGVVKQDLLDVLTDDWEEAKKSNPTLEDLLDLVHTQILVGVAPAALSDDSHVNNGSSSRGGNDGRWALSPVQHQWQQHANANRQRVEAIAEFRDGLAPFPALLDPAAAPTRLADFGPSAHWPDGIIAPATLEALHALDRGDGGAALFGDHSGNKNDVARWECIGVASLPLFTTSFCAHVIATLEAYEGSGLPTVRPNSMNNYGAVLSRLGFAPLLRSLQELVAAPLAAALDAHHWGDQAAAAAAAAAAGTSAVASDTATLPLPLPSSGPLEAAVPTASPSGVPPAPSGGKDDDLSVASTEGLQPVTEASWLDGQHVFSVRYKAGEDLSLDLHTDDSEVTLNACLGKPGFEGSGLVFCGTLGAADHRVMKIRYRHELGRCVVHKGSQRHGADEITGGERVNLVMWHRSLAFRRRKERTARPYDAEGAPPSLECLSFTHDRDYLVHQPKGTVLSPAASLAAGGGWCPPPGKEFQPPSSADSTKQLHEEKAPPTV